MIDLHMHTTASDGKLSPQQVVDTAIAKGISTISITDHDTIRGLREALEYAKGRNLEIIPGIEVTADPIDLGSDFHIVGLFIDPADEKFEKMMIEKTNNSKATARKMIDNLRKFGFDISFEELEKETNGLHYGRPHIARILMRKYPQRFADRKQVFNEFLGSQGRAYVPPIAPNVNEVVKFIHSVGGLAILAHSWYFGEKLDRVLDLFLKAGGDGLEICKSWKGEIPVEIEAKLRDFAKKNDLVISGGTDFHENILGEREIGDRGITQIELDNLRKRNSSRINSTMHN